MLIFDLTKNYVPEVYSRSRDYKVFLKMLGVICTVFKYDIDNSMSLYEPNNCPDNLLPLLSGMVGYDYDENLSVDSNRLIIENFPKLIRNKGSEIGLKLAALLSLQTTPMRSEEVSFKSVYVDFNYENAIIYIYYDSSFSPNFSLIEKVRPVGTTLKIYPSHIVRANDHLYIQANGGVESYKYDRDELSRVYDEENEKGSKVNFGVVDQDNT